MWLKGSLVVMSGGKVAGIVTLSDLLDLLARTIDRRSNRARKKSREEPEWE